MEETFKGIVGYEGHYEVSNSGTVKSLKPRKEVFLKPEEVKGGYLRVSLMKDGKKSRKMIHRLVYEAFVGDIVEGYIIHHKDEDPKNNRLDNLELCDQQYNLEYSLSRHYRVINPEGEYLEVFNLSKFCRENNLSLSAMSEMATKLERRDRKSLRLNHKGYFCEYSDNKPKRGVFKHEC